MTRLAALVSLASFFFLLPACRQSELGDQPKYTTYSAAPGWPGNQAAREPVAGTVARDEPLGTVPDEPPMQLARPVLETGKNRFEIFCAPCHGLTGHGNGMIVQRGFPAPPSYHSERLRRVPLRYFYDVISNGYGVMFSYATQLAPPERWAVAAYVRALQLSQHARLEDLTPAQRARLERAP